MLSSVKDVEPTGNLGAGEGEGEGSGWAGLGTSDKHIKRLDRAQKQLETVSNFPVSNFIK